jgi:hypothetical protein
MGAEHDNMRETWPGSWVVGSRPKIDIVIVTSGHADKAFETGQDNDTDLGL